MSDLDRENIFDVTLPEFAGPLDLLLHLAKQQDVNLLNLPMTKIINQYIEHIDKFLTFGFEEISDYLLMLAELVEIKSKLLLPNKNQDTEIAVENITNKIREYEIFKVAGENLAELPREGRDFFIANITPDKVESKFDKITMDDIFNSYKELHPRVNAHNKISFNKEIVSVSTQKTKIASKLYSSETGSITFNNLFGNKAEAVASFIASLDMAKEGFCELEQQNTSNFQIKI